MKGLRTVIYKVGDLQKAKQWYEKAFEQAPYFDEPYYVGFEIDGYELGLLPEETSAIQKSDNVLAYWAVKDIHAVFDRLVKLGATAHESPHNVGGELMVATVRDPWQNVLGIIYNPYFEVKE